MIDFEMVLINVQQSVQYSMLVAMLKDCTIRIDNNYDCGVENSY